MTSLSLDNMIDISLKLTADLCYLVVITAISDGLVRGSQIPREPMRINISFLISISNNVQTSTDSHNIHTSLSTLSAQKKTQGS